jgi:hypothetical protein
MTSDTGHAASGRATTGAGPGRATGHAVDLLLTGAGGPVAGP